jgi:predicted DNA-binding transcriptional regulator AlpA
MRTEAAMADPRVESVELAADAAATNSHAAAPKPSRIPAPLHEGQLLARTFWSVPETAFMCRVGVRTVWRLMADPRSGFPTPRRLRGRTLLARDDVLAYLQEVAR